MSLCIFKIGFYPIKSGFHKNEQHRKTQLYFSQKRKVEEQEVDRTTFQGRKAPLEFSL